ncbi:Suppressor of glycerol defect protein 1 [Pseudocercospora fuligena]|uniref:Suppressor of glycerol defect protein 1 n=1 Tax=Pseudocercospora fuligena TaxID=685502 RepID=A0A8H6RQM9_9PEZI|nr:Suppressor of glycerol defect protein 1 [Pseudocercospora fuligena]
MAKLDEDDDEIARLEKKLGIKKGRKKVGDDELDWLVGGGDSGDEDVTVPGKRKRAVPDDDDWLKQKRLKASKPAKQAQRVEKTEVDELDDESDLDEEGEDSALEELANPFSEDEISEGDFEGFEEEGNDDGEAEVPAARKRENPYIAPVAPSAAKYVPPSLRKAPNSDEETLKQLRRQMQGNLNRLSETNIISILASIQEIYAKNARQHCTAVLVELLRERVADPSDPGDNALILFAGFATALYRVIGTDFAAQLLESLVDEFDRNQEGATEGKQTVNILSFLSNLYVLQTLGCEIIFEYIKLLLGDFTEANTVLLLRIVRIAGQQLRQDDPSALKDIVLLLQRSVAAAGGVEKLSQRTRVMIDFIHDLKNNRVKANRGPDATAQEHMQRMKKTLSTIKNAKTSEPLRIGLADIRESEKKGKWWLVGASWRDPAKMANASASDPTTKLSTSVGDVSDESDDSEAGVDLNALAKAQGMNTDVRKAIFISVAGAVDPQHAHLRLMKLNLKNKQMLEVPRVVMHCVGAEPVYNHFYTLVGLKFCSDRRMKKAWQFALLDVLRRCGEDNADDEEDDIRPADELSVRQVYNIAKLYATLISEGLLRISILKPMRFATLQPKSQIFAEVLITTLFVLLRKNGGKEKFGSSVEEVFGEAHFVPGLVKGLAYFIETVMPGSDVPTKKEKKVVDAGCEYASSALHDEAKQSKAISGADGDDSDVEGSIEVDWD